jgi:exopolysaccharide biosynthesis polyprenyl glycosylphosphotransferase
MTTSRAKGIAKLGIGCQCIFVTISFWLWLFAVRGHGNILNLNVDRYALYNGVLLIGIVLGYATKVDNSWFTQLAFFSAQQHAMRQTAISTGLLLLLLTGERSNTISRFFLFTFLPILYLNLIFTERFSPSFLRRVSFGGGRTQRVLVAGCCRNAVNLKGWLESKEQLGYSVAGIICHDRSIGALNGLKIMGTAEDLERIIIEQDITNVILAEFPQFRNLIAHYSEVCERRGVRLQIVCDFERTLRHPVTMFEDEGLRFIGLRAEPLEDPFWRLSKRCLDIIVSLMAVVLILPWSTLLVWGLQRKYSPGPVFFRQLRSGLQNLPFAIYKYRTMCLDNDDPNRQATKDDARVYKGARWLRKFSIDELPQFLNVLRGQMSLVGPRPHLPKHDELFARGLINYPVRVNVKPGITGLAQVRGFRGEARHVAEIMNRVESDIYYLENWTFLWDCWILLRTAVQVIRPPPSAF